MNMKDLIAKMTAIEEGKKVQEDDSDKKLDATKSSADDVNDDMPAEDKPKKKEIKESVDVEVIKDLTNKLAAGEIDYDEFKAGIEEAEYTDYSMRQGEMGNPDIRDDMAWDRERDEWDQLDSLEGEEDDEDEYEPGEEGDDWEDPRDQKESVTNEDALGECGGEVTSIPMHSEQSDSVSMTINMSGSGKGGIHDILDVIRNIENGKDGDREMSPVSSMPHDATMIIGTKSLDRDTEESFANQPNEKYSSFKEIMASGNDLHKSKDSYSDKPFRGDNPMAIKEKLDSLYKFVKNK